MGGSIGTALLAVVLEDQIKAAMPAAVGIGHGALRPIPPGVRARIAEPLAHAFTHTFWWALALSAAAVLPALLLAVAARGAPVASQPGVSGGTEEVTAAPSAAPALDPVAPRS